MKQFKLHSSYHLVILMAFSFLLLTLTVSQSNSNLVFDLLEEQKANTFVGDVAKASGVLSEVAPANVPNLRYQILGSDGLRTSSLFTINSHSGSLYTNAMIDREQVCESAAVTCRLEFDVTVKLDISVLRILHVIILVRDINDNAPTFPNKDLNLSISEASPKGSDYSISGAVDRDAQIDAMITYWMEDNTVFGLREEKLLGVSLLKVVLLQGLDRERQCEYHLHIYAKDGNTSFSLTGTLSVTITVTDENDNNPEFAMTVFNFNVSEDADVGSWVGTIDASDLDVGENGRITFLFSPLTPGKVRQLFDLNADTGNVTVKSTLEFESGEMFQAVVVATDHGRSPKASQTVLVVNVLDAGNTSPKLFIMLANPIYQNSTLLSEDLPVGSFVGRLKYLDNDEGDNGVVDCMSLNPHFTLVPLEERGFGVEVKASFDRETEPEIAVVIKCSDRGTPSLSAFVNFTARLSDVNDNKPIFTRSDYSSRVKENELSQQNIVQVSAADHDEGINSEVTYHLSVNTSNAFSIDPFTGWISLNSPVDREAEPILLLIVEAVDKGKPSLTGSVTATVFVEDINDNAAQIVRADYQVKENEEPGTFLAQIIAEDSDDGVNGQLTFQLISDSTKSFKVSKSGVITTSKILDRETVDRYTIVVSASDMGTPSLTTTSTLTITITDDNDHSPHIMYPVPGNDTLTVSANLSPGAVVAIARAADLDLKKNAHLLYLIAEGNPRQIFSIDNSTGAIFLTKRLTTGRDTSYRLTISVQDGGNPRLHNNAYLYIKVDFTNATLVDSASDMEHKYIIMAGVISGITVMVTIIVIAIILKLRNMEPPLRSEVVPKFKDISLVSADAKDVSEVSVPQMSTFKICSENRESELSGDKGEVRNLSNPFGCNLTSGCVPMLNRLILSRELLEHQRSAQFSHFPEGRQHRTSEDIHSDTSGDTTASDSGRGASDAEDISSGASLNSGASSAKLPTSRLSLKGHALVASSSSSEHRHPGPTHASSSLVDLARAARVYGSQTNFDNMRRAPSKVRFSFDDQNIHNPQLARSQPSYHQHSANREQLQKRFTRTNHTVLNEEQKNQYHKKFSSVSSNTNTSQSKHGPVINSHQISRTSSDQPNGVSSFLLSKDAPVTLSWLHPGSRQQQQQQSPSKHTLLLSHHNPYHLHHNERLVSMNISADEDDDDMSTTTSGSYVVDGVDDTISRSVDC